MIGSQSVLGAYPDAPAPLLRSMEADMYPRTALERADVIDGAIGEATRFHETYGYYAHAVGPETAVAPHGWEERLVPIEVTTAHGLRRGWCMETHDLVVAKLAAGRERDIEFADQALVHALVEGAILRSRAALLPVTHRELVIERVDGAVVRAARRSA